MTTPRAYQAAMELLYDDGQWYRLPRWIFKIQPTFKKHQNNGSIVSEKRKMKTEAYTFAAVLNQSSVNKAALQNDGWFEFSEKRAEEDTGFLPDRQKAHLDLLVSCGLIEEGGRAKELCGRRTFRVNYEHLVALIEELLEPEKAASRFFRLPGNPGSAYREIREALTGKSGKPRVKTNTKKKKRRPSAKNAEETERFSEPITGGRPVTDPEHGLSIPGEKEAGRTEGKRLADLLYRGLVKRRKIMRPPSLMVWGRKLDALSQEVARRDNITCRAAHTYLETVIQAHVDHLEDDFWPKIYSAAALCERLVDLEDAIARLRRKEARAPEDSKEELRRYLFEAALRAAEADGNYSVKKDGRLYERRPGSGSWVQVTPGDESDTAAPADVVGYILYLRGEWDGVDIRPAATEQ